MGTKSKNQTLSQNCRHKIKISWKNYHAINQNPGQQIKISCFKTELWTQNQNILENFQIRKPCRNHGQQIKKPGNKPSHRQ